jgi:hypothetical protein
MPHLLFPLRDHVLVSDSSCLRYIMLWFGCTYIVDSMCDGVVVYIIDGNSDGSLCDGSLFLS